MSPSYGGNEFLKENKILNPFQIHTHTFKAKLLVKIYVCESGRENVYKFCVKNTFLILKLDVLNSFHNH